MSAPRMVEKIKEIYTAQRDATAAHNRLSGILSGGPASFYYEKMDEYIQGLLSFSKFKIGDRVALVKDIDCSDKPGWAGCEHFLKAGATARVTDLDYCKGGFQYAVEFDHETYLHFQTKKPEPIKDKHQFWFRETSLG